MLIKIIFFSVFLIALYFLFFHKTNQIEQVSYENTVQKLHQISTNALEKANLLEKENTRNSNNIYKDSFEDPVVQYNKRKKEKSELLKAQFLNTAYLNGELPKGFLFSNISAYGEGENDILVLVGENEVTGDVLRVIGTTLLPKNPKEALQYFQEHIYLFPKMNPQLARNMKLYYQTPYRKSGFKNLVVWAASDEKSQKSEAMALLEREDGRGVYAFSFSGNTSAIEDEDYLENLLSQISARNPPQ